LWVWRGVTGADKKKEGKTVINPQGTTVKKGTGGWGRGGSPGEGLIFFGAILLKKVFQERFEHGQTGKGGE